MKKITLSIVKNIKALSKNYVPRWIILLIDSTIALIAAFVSFFLVDTIDAQQELFNFNNGLWGLFAIQVFYFFAFKSYAGIVRYTSFKDAFRQLQTTISTVGTVLIINQFLYYYLGKKIIYDAGVIIYGFIAFSSLYFFRIIVKRAYQIVQANTNSSKAYVLGTDLTDVAIAEGIISDPKKKFAIVGFISEKKQAKKNKIFTLPIISVDQIPIKRTKGDSIIVSSEKLIKINRENPALIQQLLEYNYKIYKLPEIQNWDNTQSLSAEVKKVNLEDLLQRNPIKLNKNKIRKTYESRTILVTGAAGSIGSDIVNQLIPFEPELIILLDQAETPLHTVSLFLDNDHPDIAYKKVIADVTNLKRLNSVFETYKPDIVFHGAAYKHVPMMEDNPFEAFSVNYMGTKNLVDLAQKYNINRFVFVSTDKAVNPTNIMGASKRSAEIYVQAAARNQLSRTNFITTRFGNVLGSNGSVIPYFKKQIENGGPVTVTHKDITRYFMTIDEACQLVLEAGAMGKGGEIYVFDMGKPVKILNLAEQMIRLSGFIPYEEIDIVFSGLRPGEKLYEELLADEENTLPTHHEKILIAKNSFRFSTENFKLLDEMTASIENCDVKNAFNKMKLLVPEYKQADNNDNQPKIKVV